MPEWLIQLIVGLVLSGISSLVSQSSKTSTTSGGYSEELQSGGDVNESFVVGTFGLKGKLEYENTWGSDGDVPNANLVRVISVSDVPICGFTGLFVNAVAVTRQTSGHVEQGYPVPEYSRSSTDYMWWEFFDGTQTTCSSYLVDKFGSDASRPWGTDAVGRGVAYLTLTSLLNKKLYTGFPDYTIVVHGIPLYDVRLDSTAGGSGSHRLADQSTWEFSDNPIVIVYNILLGIRYAGSWVWGMQEAVDQARLPYARWSAAMDACDASVGLSGGGTERAFRVGREIKLSDTPASVIDDLLVCCNARWSEVAGIFDIVVGDPGSSDVSFTDADVITSEQATLDPFPNLDKVINGATAQYTSPDQAWVTKDAAPYNNADLVTADDDRTQLTALSLQSVFSGTQAQRIEQAVVLDSRRFLRHALYMRPQFSAYSPLSVFTWTSAKNGYSSKKFFVSAMTEDDQCRAIVGLQEFDPSDHSWTPDTDQQPETFAPVLQNVVPSQPMTGWSATAATRLDQSSSAWMPTATLAYAGRQPDVMSVRVQAREGWGSNRVVLDAEYPYDPSESAPSVLVDAHFQQGADYQLRGQFLPFSGRDTDWSSWLTVTMEAVPSVPPGSVWLPSLEPELAAAHGLVTTDDPGSIPTQLADLLQRTSDLATGVIQLTASYQETLTALRASNQGTVAGVTRQEVAIATLNTSLASITDQVVAVVDNLLASGLFSVVADVNSLASTATITLQAKASAILTAIAGIIIQASADGLGGSSARVGVVGGLDVYPDPSSPAVSALEVDVDGVIFQTGRFTSLVSTAVNASDGTPIIQIDGATGLLAIQVD